MTIININMNNSINKNNNPIIQIAQNAVLAAKDNEEDVLISTVMISLNNLKFYELMIFGGEYDGHEKRSGSKDEILSYHKKMTNKIRKSMGRKIK